MLIDHDGAAVSAPFNADLYRRLPIMGGDGTLFQIEKGAPGADAEQLAGEALGEIANAAYLDL
jgi:hypothetical protein